MRQTTLRTMPDETPPETRYRCPRCKLTVVVLLDEAKVSCTRCGRPMKAVTPPSGTRPDG